MYYTSPYVTVNGQKMLDEPWWHITNDTEYTITVTNGDGSDEVDIESGKTSNLMWYGTKSFKITFPNGFQSTITTRTKNISIKVDEDGNLVTE